MSCEGVEVNPVRTATLQEWPTPCVIKDVRAFLEFASYYKRYIHNFASVAIPLAGVLKDTMLVWDDDCEQAFQLFKKAPVQPTILMYHMRDGRYIGQDGHCLCI